MPTYLCHGFRWHRQSILRQIVKNDLEDAALHWIIAPRSKVQIIQSFHDMLGLSGEDKNDAEPESKPAQTPPQPLMANDTQATISTHREQPKVNITTTTSSSPPEIFLLEEYNPDDLVTFASPWAYVADYAKRIDTSVSVFEEIVGHERNLATHGLMGLAISGVAKTDSGRVTATWLEDLKNRIQEEEKIDWYVVVCGDEVRAGSESEEGSDEEGDNDDGNEGEE